MSALAEHDAADGERRDHRFGAIDDAGDRRRMRASAANCNTKPST